MMDFKDVHWKENGRLKLLIIVGTRPEIIRLSAVINKTRQYFDVILAHRAELRLQSERRFLPRPVSSGPGGLSGRGGRGPG